MNQSHRDVCETWFRRVWWEKDESAIDEMLVPEGRARGLGDRGMPPMVGPDDFKVFHRALLALIDNVQVNIEHFISEGDWSSMLIRAEATSKATGEAVEMRGHVLVKILGGKLAEGYNNLDFIGFFEQLDLIPPNALSTCLAGKKIG